MQSIYTGDKETVMLCTYVYNAQKETCPKRAKLSFSETKDEHNLNTGQYC